MSYDEKEPYPHSPRPSRLSDGVSSGEGWGGDGSDYRLRSGLDHVGGSEPIPSSFLCYVPRHRAAEYEKAGWKIGGIADDRGYSFIGEWQGGGEPVIP